MYINETLQKHSTNITKTQYKQYRTQQIEVHILPKHTHVTKTTTVQVKTNTVQDTPK